MTTRKEIADKIFPDVIETIQDLEKKYPPRPNPICSRFAPSPTGFLHIGGIFASLVEQRFAKQNGGTFILRIEDTDQKREIPGAVDLIIDGLNFFGIEIDEGPLGENNTDKGDYGPYIQSHRKYIYQIFAKTLIEKGLAYPCWMSESELEEIRTQQTTLKVTPGIYGNYSLWRNKTPEEIMQKLESDSNFVLRFRSHGDFSQRCEFDDVIKGKINMIDNYNDIVLIKSDGLPTYHLAHITDDYLMRTSHVIRGDEWLTSVPLHIQLFKAFDLPHPHYCHVAPLLKFDEEGNKRKLSKRKDPEADISYFFQSGYAPEGIIDYLLTIVDPAYEERQKANPSKNYLDFEIKIDHMNTSGALFDLVKLQSMNNAYLSKISTDELYNQSLIRANKYRPNLADLMQVDVDYTKAALNIERHTQKDPKRFTTFQDVESQILFFYDKEWEKLLPTKPTLPEMCTADNMKPFIEEYKQQLNLDMTLEDWFAQLKEIGKKYGFASNNAEFKEGGYIGKVGDLAMFMRIQLCATAKTPDLYSVMKVLGKDRVIERLGRA
ncbi:MAG: glutamate--tRNA ligase [Candidatus Absconditabacteria bacterium]|nr:glutamate--tRNA ligase [Candidatus Absconditabacteria bacterium]